MADFGNYYVTGKFKDKEGEEFQLVIQKDGYYGDPKKLIYINPNSLEYGTRGGRDMEYSNLQGSEMNFSLYSQNIELFNDNYFESDFKIWKQKYNPQLPWWYQDGNLRIEVDGNDTSAYLYQTCYLQQGEGYELHLTFTLNDPNEDSFLWLRLENDTVTTTQDVSIISTDSSGEYDMVIPFTATSYFTTAGLQFMAGGAYIDMHSISMKKKKGINFDELLTANYQQYKAVLTHYNKKFDNSNFDTNPFVNYTTQKTFINEGTGTNWNYIVNGYDNKLIKPYSGADYLTPSKYLTHPVNIQRLQAGKVKLKVGYDNDLNKTKIKLRFWEDDGYWTEKIIFSGNSPSNIYLSVGTTVISQEFIPALNQEVFELEYNLSESHFISKVGLQHLSDDEGCTLYHYDVVLDDILFSGFVKPDNITKRFRAEQYFIDVNCIDGLADLKNIPYVNDGSRASALTIIREVLAKTGHIIPLSIQNGIQNIDATTMWFNINIDRRKFIEDQKGKIKFKNCYEVLEMILKSYFCKLTMSNNEWLLQNHNEIESYRYTYYDAINPALYYNSTHDRKVNIDTLPYSPDSDELSMIAPIKSVRVEVDNQFTNDSLNLNSDFLFTISPWSNYLSNWNAYQRIDDDGKQFLRCRANAPLPIGNRVYGAAQQFKIPSTRYPLDRLKFSFEVAKISAGATNLLRCQLIYGDNTGAQKDIPLSGYTNTFEKAEFEFPVQFSPTNNHIITVIFGVMNNGSNATAIECYFDNPKLEIDWSDEPNDKSTYFIESDSMNPLLEELEETLSFADINYTNDNSSLGYSVSATTTSWKNYDNSITGVPLAELYGTERLRSNYTYKEYIRGSFYDPKITVKLNSIVQLNGKNYKCLGNFHNIFNGMTELEAVEHKIDDVSDLSATYIKALTAFE